MIDEREDAEKALETEGLKKTDHATVEDPTGADAVAAKTEATITDEGLVTPEANPEEFETEE